MAAEALAHGWDQNTLLTLHQWMKDAAAGAARWITADRRWAIVVEHETDLLVYRSYTPTDVELVFMPPTWDLTKPESRVVAYTDGSGTTAKKAAGIGVALYRQDAAPEYVAENIGEGTNNRAELCAIWRALRAVPDTGRDVDIYSDSEYAIGALTQDWARNVNAELIENIRIDLTLRQRQRSGGHKPVRFFHVDGHAGNEGNEVADKLANIGRKLVKKISLYEG
jgi:ribonuclease HI